MSSFRSHDYLPEVSRLVTISSSLPALTYAGRDNDKSNDGENNGRGNDKGARQISVVSWANAALGIDSFYRGDPPGLFVAIA
jgi:hypothetical protein